MADSLRFREDLVARGTRSLFIRFFSLWTVRELLFRTTRRSLPGVVLLERVQLARGDSIGLDGVRLSQVGAHIFDERLGNLGRQIDRLHLYGSARARAFACSRAVSLSTCSGLRSFICCPMLRCCPHLGDTSPSRRFA